MLKAFPANEYQIKFKSLKVGKGGLPPLLEASQVRKGGFAPPDASDKLKFVGHQFPFS